MKMGVLFFSFLLGLNAVAKPKCSNVSEFLSSSTKIYGFVNELAKNHVYYGAIDAKNIKPISKTYLTKVCTEGSSKGYIVRFQTTATVDRKTKLFYCYSKIFVVGGRWYDRGAFCENSLGGADVTIEFPYEQASDPYAQENLRYDPSGVDGYFIEFEQNLGVGFDSGLDPFYTPRTNDGPDAVTGDGL